jgi:Fe-S-cluster containining protein
MDADEAYRSLAHALRTANQARERLETEVARLRGELDALTDVLAGRGVIAEGHRRTLSRAGEEAVRAADRPKVRLRLYVDKYQIPDAGIDCAARLHLCHGRCCAMTVELTTQDLDEGGVRWEVEAPYLLRHEPDGWCTHLDRGAVGCTIYEKRPATCRAYSCVGDPRVWIDFEQRIPAPMPDRLLPPDRPRDSR